MAQTLVTLLVHVVFSTKNRINLIPSEIEPDLFAFIGGILRVRGSHLIAAGCTQNHIHLLISLSKNDLLTQVMRDLKSRTSRWMKEKDTSLRSFQWQEGYGAFSIGASLVPALRSYLERQKEHHRKRTFEDEFVALLEKIRYGIRRRVSLAMRCNHDPFRVGSISRMFPVASPTGY